MIVYRCCSCGKVFDEPMKQYERSEFWGAPGWTGYYVSPCCKEAFDEIDDDEVLEDAV